MDSPRNTEDSTFAAMRSRRDAFKAFSAVGVVGAALLARSAEATRVTANPSGTRVLNIYDVTDYGAVSYGPAAANTSAFQSAIMDASAAGGAIVYVPPGTYFLNPTIVLQDGVRLQGAGRATQLVAATATGDLIQVSGQRCFIEHLQFTTLVARTSGAYIKNWNVTTYGHFLTISNCYFNGGYDQIAGDYASDLRVLDCNLAQFTNRGIVLGQTGLIQNIYLSGLEISTNSSTASCGIYAANTGGLFVSQVDIYGAMPVQAMDYGILLNPAAGQYSKWTFLDQVQCDSCQVDGLSANGVGPVQGLFVSNSWFATNGQQGANMGYGGTVTGVSFTGCVFANNGYAGLNLNNNCAQVTLTGCLVSGNSVVTPHAWPGISVATGVRELLIGSTVVGPSMGFANNHSYGINFQSQIGVVRASLTGNSLSHNFYGATYPALGTLADVVASANI